MTLYLLLCFCVISALNLRFTSQLLFTVTGVPVHSVIRLASREQRRRFVLFVRFNLFLVSWLRDEAQGDIITFCCSSRSLASK